MHFQPVDHVPDEEFGYWEETLDIWHAQGLPEWVDDDAKAGGFFGLAGRAAAPIDVGMRPGFEYKVLEEDERHLVVIDGDGATKMVNKDGASSIPKYLKFPIETHRDWEDFRDKRLDPREPGRFPEEQDWQKFKLSAKDHEYPLGIIIGSLFGRIRDWMGFENVSYAIMDDPVWVREIIDHLGMLIYTTIERAIKEVDFDFAAGWEDMCFNHGPILQPKYFEEWMCPNYKRICDLLKDNGCDVVQVDCDGNINELVPHWLAAGVNCMFPIEVRGGTDPVKLREKYGRRVLLAGGVDKTRLIAGKEAIREEVLKLKPLVEDGGYIPHVDHRCPPDVTYENYLYYLKFKRETYGIGEPEDGLGIWRRTRANLP
ncbi:MAG: hypothetical protein M1423_09285 [Acidobacteria bacterium]|nr:hypothetical protein [Acidobacteriota bacterium]